MVILKLRRPGSLNRQSKEHLSNNSIRHKRVLLVLAASVRQALLNRRQLSLMPLDRLHLIGSHNVPPLLRVIHIIHPLRHSDLRGQLQL